MHDKFHPVPKAFRKLLALILVASLPAFTGGALASVVCEESSAPGHAHAAEQALASAGENHAAGGAAGSADDCGGCDLCYSHCTLSLPAVSYGYFVANHGAVAQLAQTPLISLSLPPADRPPLPRRG